MGGPQDVTEDVEFLVYLLGGPRPAHYSEEDATALRAHYSVRRGHLLVETEQGYRVYPTAI